MKLIVGLGNPGKKYEGTRHNTGFFVLEELKTGMINSQYSFPKQISTFNFQYKKQFMSEMVEVERVLLVKPQTFMNMSGSAVAKIVRFYKIDLSNLFVVHDDLDIELGSYKIQLGKGPKVHNGLDSLYERLGTKHFWHVRVGVDTRGEERKIDGKAYVLQRFTVNEKQILDEVTDRVVVELRVAVLEAK